MSKSAKRVGTGMWMLGRKLSEETKRKIGEAFRGENSHFWKGGISYNPYSIDWGITIRQSIRERDKYTCQICRKIQSNYKFSVHHIDYDKKNCNQNNLITLCRNCHIKTNFKRNYWMSVFSRN